MIGSSCAFGLLLCLSQGDPPTAQELIDSARPGGLVVLSGENSYDGRQPLRITKPLTVYAKSRYRVMSVQDSPVVPLHASIQLQGPGAGVVALYNLELTGLPYPEIPDEFEGQGPAPRIQGGGFDALELYFCDVVSPRLEGEVEHPVGGEASFVGRLYGASAIDVTVDNVLLVHSSCQASAPWIWFDCPFSAGVPGAAGIEATGLVEIFNSFVSGAELETRCEGQGPVCDFYYEPPSEARGPLHRMAGPGVRAREMVQHNSIVVGGPPARLMLGTPLNYTGYCGYGWPGLPFEPRVSLGRRAK